MKFIVTAVLIVLSSFCLAQKNLDYRKMKDTICPSICGYCDSLSLTEIYPVLLALDTTRIKKNLALYYEDLADIEYNLCMRTHDLSYMRKSAEHSEMVVFHDPNPTQGCRALPFVMDT